MAHRLIDQTREQGPRLRKPRPDFPRRIARRGVAVLPTLFTLGNLLAGCAAIFVASRPADTELPFDWTPLTFAAVFIFVGMLFDGLDGRIARLTRSTSDLGGQLDSMADMVTFGVAPAFLAIQLVGVETPFVAESTRSSEYFDRVALLIGAIYVACAALRLARFNIEDENPEEADHLSFKGLPSPGAAGTVASLILLHEHFLAHYAEPQWLVRAAAVAMIATTLLVALAMVSSFRYVHVMNRYVRNRAAFGAVAKAVIIALLLLVHPQGALAAAFVLYALSAPAASLCRWSAYGVTPCVGRIIRWPSRSKP